MAAVATTPATSQTISFATKVACVCLPSRLQVRAECGSPLRRGAHKHVWELGRRTPTLLQTQNGLASTRYTIAMNSTSGSSLNQRSAREDGSDLPFNVPFNQRPVKV